MADTTPPVRFLIYPEHGSTFVMASATVPTPQLARSPDGTQVAFVATHVSPFWSSDSRSIGFMSSGQFRTLGVAGGVPLVRLAASADSRGATWAEDDTIVAVPTAGGALLLSSPKGPTTPLTTVDRAARDISHRWPWFLP